MPPVKQLNGLAASLEATRVVCCAAGDYARVIASGSLPYHDIRLSFSDHEVSEICLLICSAFCPKDEELAPVLSGVRAVFPA